MLTGLTVTTFLLLFPILQCSAAPLNVPKYKKFALVCFFGRRSPLVFWDWPKSLLVCCSTFLRDSERFCTAGLFACLHNSRRAPFYNNQKFFPPLYLALINVAAGNVTILIFCKVTSLHHFSDWIILMGKDRNKGPDVMSDQCKLLPFTKERSRLRYFATVATAFCGFQSFLRTFLIELSNFCDLKIVIDTFGALWWARHLLEFCVNRSDACFDHLKIQQLATPKILVTDGIRKRRLHLEDTQCLPYFGNV